jgi:hypothetical protein
MWNFFYYAHAFYSGREDNKDQWESFSFCNLARNGFLELKKAALKEQPLEMGAANELAQL